MTRLFQDDSFPMTRLAAAWREQFGAADGRRFFCASAPGRVNLIGEHTDYHDGFVFPAAIDLKTYVLASPRSDRMANVYSLNLSERSAFDLEGLEPGKVTGWARYVAGSAWVLQSIGISASGIDAVVFGNIPFGGGLSSSAAIEVAWIKLWADIAGVKISRPDMARLGQKAENGFVGVPCGIMDQFASANCKAGHAMLLDCRSLEPVHASVPASWRIVVCDTGVHHELASGEYAKRQHECRVGLAEILKKFPQIKALRDVDFTMLDEVKEYMPDLSYRRCRHVIGENERAQRFALALDNENGDLAGDLMAASHTSLRDDYNVSCKELDRAVELANGLKGLVGARMTGGGFGGSTVNLVEATAAETFREELEDAYRSEHGGKGHALLLTPSNGVTGGECGGLD
jgi:galactokinase